MNESQSSENILKSPADSNLPGCWIVASRELSDLWNGGKIFILLILFSIGLGVMSFLLATNSELSLIPPDEMVFLILQITLGASILISLIIGADSISGERERATLEGLLLTPVSRRQVVLGKFIGAFMSWPVFFLISIPYLSLLSPNPEVLELALLWGAILGSFLVAALTAFGIIVSIWSNNNKASFGLSLIFYFLILIPTQLPSTAKTGAIGKLLQKANPLEASSHFLMSVVIGNQRPESLLNWLVAPALFALLTLGFLFWLISPGLHISGARIILKRKRIKKTVGLIFIICSTISPAIASVMAMEMTPDPLSRPPLAISVNMDYTIVKTGDKFEFDSFVQNDGRERSSPLVIAMNIVNLKNGDPVDPEDWSPERAQYVDPLPPGMNRKLNWKIHAILQGDYMAYLVVIPTPVGKNVTSKAVASSGLHITVNPYVRLNPRGILPLAFGMPGVLITGFLLLKWRRRRMLVAPGSN